MKAPTRIAAPLVLVYWLALVAGLAAYSVILDDLTAVMPLWMGALLGTLLGQFLAVCDLRLWFIVIVLTVVMAFGIPLAPSDLADKRIFWMTFAPAVLSGAISLADRFSLAALWFPAVIWMLSVLDRTDGKSTPDGSGAVLLGVLAVAAIAFMRARETRRVALWKTVHPGPISTAKRTAVLRERAGAGAGRAGWMLVVTAVAFGVTAWLAPKLWQLETFAEPPIAQPNAYANAPGNGIPCCPSDDADVSRSRVKEYFDIGRGRDSLGEKHHHACVPCDDGDGVVPVFPNTYGNPVVGIVPSGGGGDGTGGGGNGTGTGTSEGDPAYAVAGTTEPTKTYDLPPYEPPQWEAMKYETPHTNPQYEPYVDTKPPTPPEPPAAVTPAPAPAPTPPPIVKPTAPPAAPHAQHPAPADSHTALLRWLVVLMTGVLAFQLARFALRPIRRAVTLRHLRRPFWDETIDQRVSNWWQLVLVGLRDAGFRTTDTETPREFARRTGIAEVDRCAAILDRTRHGVRVDTGDLDALSAASEAAYRSSRSRTGTFARLVAWLRWPLA